MEKIEGINYIKNKQQQVKYLHDNPGVARRMGVNILNLSSILFTKILIEFLQDYNFRNS